MDIQIMPRIDLWFDGENYGYAIDFEDDELDPLSNVIEGYQPTLEGAIDSINLAIARQLQRYAETP